MEKAHKHHQDAMDFALKQIRIMREGFTHLLKQSHCHCIASTPEDMTQRKERNCSLRNTVSGFFETHGNFPQDEVSTGIPQQPQSWTL